MTNTVEILKIVREMSRAQDLTFVMFGIIFALVVFLVAREMMRDD